MKSQKIKIFCGENELELEKRVNDFIQDKEVISIHCSNVLVDSPEYNLIYNITIVIIYKTLLEQ